MPGRQYTGATGYRFGFNGKESDDEVKGSDNSYDFGARVYDPRLGKFFSIDPLFKIYPNESSYGFAGNSPIYLVDKDGELKIVYWTIIDKSGHSQTFKVFQSDEVLTIRYDATGEHDVTSIQYDVIVHTKIDYSSLNVDGTPKISTTSVLNEKGKREDFSISK
ncbi:MAG: hypothetical protein IPH89_02485 [Bacteroidetes bacterium]|nr:hypothetical protein [Bacteroidota bacterium]